MPGYGESFFCALLTNEPEALNCRCGARWPASQPPRVLHILDSSPPPPTRLLFFPPLGSRAAMLKGIFCALPEQVWIKAAASPSPTCPALYYPSEVFAKKENLTILTSSISSLLPMLCFSHRTCFLLTICRDQGCLYSSQRATELDGYYKILRDQSQQTLVALLSNSTWKCKLQCIYKLASKIEEKQCFILLGFREG